MPAVHKFIVDEVPEAAPAEQDRSEEMAAWVLALLLLMTLATGFVLDELALCAAAAEADGRSACTPSAAPDRSGKWHHANVARRATTLQLMEEHFQAEADAR